MKKVKKLVLCRETLRSLENPVLVKGWGGKPAATAFDCTIQTGDSCDCTFTCPYLCQVSREVSCLCV
ncbi:MAG TPA: hypothetical protein VMW27_24265 [Thermoanaerobaculia bacterium]|nr:hypothetical protein [Thermoanaerobaculia bacterium]